MATHPPHTDGKQLPLIGYVKFHTKIWSVCPHAIKQSGRGQGIVTIIEFLRHVCL